MHFAWPSLCLLTAALAGLGPLFAQPVRRLGLACHTRHLRQTTRVDQNFGHVPLRFEPSGDSTSFIARGSGYSVRLNPAGALLSLGAGDVVTMKLEGAHPVQPAASDRLPGTVNYFLGNDAQCWRTNIPTYAKVAYSNIYPGVDLVYYGNRRALEYDLVVAPQASVKPIRLPYEGAHLSLEKSGDLKITGPHGIIAFHQPVAYQADGTTKQPVHARFVRLSDTEVAFAVGRYNRNQPLIIDPQIAYSTYFEGATSQAIAVDSAGSAYITGSASPAIGSLPVTPGALRTTYPDPPPAPANSSWAPAVFVTKLSPDGESLLYSTYIGGTGDEQGYAIAVDSAGNAYVTGETHSIDFPVTPGAFQTTNREPFFLTSTAFVIKLNPSGTGLVYSTYLGGGGPSFGDLGYGIAVDANGDAYVTGAATSTDFPVTPGAYQSTNKAAASAATNIFVTKFNANGTGLIYSTYIGGSGTRSFALPTRR